MQTLILWLLAVCGLVSIWVYLRMLFYRAQHKVAVHYFLYTQNSQGIIEWIIRYLAELSKLEGRSFYFYILDFGSEDDTLAIVERLRKNGLFIEVMDSSLVFAVQEQEQIPERQQQISRPAQEDLRLIIDLRDHVSAKEQVVSVS